jgi:hypothetical protein
MEEMQPPKNAKPRKPRRINLESGVTKAMLLASHTQCQYFMTRKQRFCNIQPLSNSRFCGNHRADGDAEGESNESAANNNNIENDKLNRLGRELLRAREPYHERIPCPLDPTHTVYKHRLQKHLKICVTHTKNKEMEEKPFYSPNCNSGTAPISSSTSIVDAAVDADALLQKVKLCFEQYVEPELLKFESEFESEAESSSSRRSIFDILRKVTANEDKIVPKASTSVTTLGPVDIVTATYPPLRRQNTADMLSEMEKAAQKAPNSTIEEPTVQLGSTLPVDILPPPPALQRQTTSEMLSSMAAATMSHTLGSTVISEPMPIMPTIPNANPNVNPNTKNVAEMSFSKARHFEQERQICLQMTKNNILPTSTSDAANGTYIVELGAGRGGLGFCCQKTTEKSTLVLVERSGMRKKCDRGLREEEASGRFYRAKMDIRHCRLSGLPGLHLPSTLSNTTSVNDAGGSGKPVPATERIVVVAKHLCGVASDLAIHSLKDPLLSPATSLRGNKEGRVGLYMACATCCHHCCNYADYSGRDWLDSLEIQMDDDTLTTFTAADYEVLVHWSGWGTGQAKLWSGRKSVSEHKVKKGMKRKAPEEGSTEKQNMNDNENENGDEDDKNEDEDEHAPADSRSGPTKHTKSSQLSTIPRPTVAESPEGPEVMARIGFMIKRILDMGRVMNLRTQLGMDAHQVRFCSPSLTPECYVIVASRPGNNK